MEQTDQLSRAAATGTLDHLCQQKEGLQVYCPRAPNNTYGHMLVFQLETGSPKIESATGYERVRIGVAKTHVDKPLPHRTPRFEFCTCLTVPDALSANIGRSSAIAQVTESVLILESGYFPSFARYLPSTLCLGSTSCYWSPAFASQLNLLHWIGTT